MSISSGFRAYNAAVTTTIRLRFDGRSKSISLPSRGHQGHSDVTLADTRGHADLYIYLVLRAAARSQGDLRGRRMVVARSKCSRIVVVTNA